MIQRKKDLDGVDTSDAFYEDKAGKGLALCETRGFAQSTHFWIAKMTVLTFPRDFSVSNIARTTVTSDAFETHKEARMVEIALPTSSSLGSSTCFPISYKFCRAPSSLVLVQVIIRREMESWSCAHFLCRWHWIFPVLGQPRMFLQGRPAVRQLHGSRLQ